MFDKPCSCGNGLDPDMDMSAEYAVITDDQKTNTHAAEKNLFCPHVNFMGQTSTPMADLSKNKYSFVQDLIKYPKNISKAHSCCSTASKIQETSQKWRADSVMGFLSTVKNVLSLT